MESKLESSTKDEKQQSLVADKKDQNEINEINQKDDTNDIVSTKGQRQKVQLPDNNNFIEERSTNENIKTNEKEETNEKEKNK